MSNLSINTQYDGLEEKENFFSLVRQYERKYIDHCREGDADYSKIGEDGSPLKEVIRFKTVSSLGFSLDRIKNIKSDSSKSNHYEFFVSFMGLLGVAGVLPQHYIRLSLERIKRGDDALAEFIGLFEHRLISLYYKAWGKYKLPIQYESSPVKGSDNFSSVLKGLSGFNRGKELQLYYAGHYSRSNRPLSNLQSIVAELINTEVVIESMVGRWLPIYQKDRCQSGIYGKNHQLGTGIVLGRRYWDVQSKIVMTIGAISMEQYLDLAPGKPLYDLLCFAVNTYVPAHIAVGFEFRIKGFKRELTPLGRGVQLSKNTWLMSQSSDILISKRVLSRT